jgi:hypothetical protein
MYSNVVFNQSEKGCKTVIPSVGQYPYSFGCESHDQNSLQFLVVRPMTKTPYSFGCEAHDQNCKDIYLLTDTPGMLWE